MNGATFLKQLEGIVGGLGFKKSIDILEKARATNGLLCTGATVPVLAALETSAIGLSVAASQTHAGTYVVNIPRDYDASADYIRLRILANSAGDTDTPTIDAAVYQKKPATALSADLDPTISAAVNNSTAKAGWVEINIDSQGVEPGDVLTIVCTTSAHTTDALSIYGIELVYKSTLVYNDNTDRS